jgi:hypothetical protein
MRFFFTLSYIGFGQMFKIKVFIICYFYIFALFDSYDEMTNRYFWKILFESKGFFFIPEGITPIGFS